MCHRNSLGNSYLHVEGVLSQGYKYIYICKYKYIDHRGMTLKEKRTQGLWERPPAIRTCMVNGVSRKSLGPKRIDQGLCRSIDLSPTISQTQRCQDDAMAAITI